MLGVINDEARPRTIEGKTNPLKIKRVGRTGFEPVKAEPADLQSDTKCITY
jgi:hypothetical protein